MFLLHPPKSMPIYYSFRWRVYCSQFFDFFEQLVFKFDSTAVVIFFLHPLRLPILFGCLSSSVAYPLRLPILFSFFLISHFPCVCCVFWLGCFFFFRTLLLPRFWRCCCFRRRLLLARPMLALQLPLCGSLLFDFDLSEYSISLCPMALPPSEIFMSSFSLISGSICPSAPSEICASAPLRLFSILLLLISWVFFFFILILFLFFQHTFFQLKLDSPSIPLGCNGFWLEAQHKCGFWSTSTVYLLPLNLYFVIFPSEFR